MSENVISIELLTTAFSSEHYPALFRGKQTHDAGLRFVAQLMPHTTDVDWITDIVASALPDSYDGDLLEEIPTMVKGALAKSFDQPASSGGKRARRTLSDTLLEIFEQTGAKLFHDSARQAFISVPLDSTGTRNFAVKSSDAEQWLREMYYRATSKAVPSQPLRDVVAMLEARAIHDGSQEDVHLRYARVGQEIFVDLGREDGKVVKMTSSLWSTSYLCPVKFYRSSGFAELPEPQPDDGGLIELQRLLQLSDDNIVLIVAFLLTAMRANGPYMCLLLEGEQGSGKSMLCELLKRIVDPNKALKFRLPESERDLMIHAREHHLVVYDNVSGLRNEMSDALCSLSTGSAFATRRLYSDQELQTFVASRPFIINGISDFANRPDLLQRAIAIHLPSMAEGTRRPERRLRAEFDALLPALLGGLFDAISCALGRETSVEAPAAIRMSDCASWLVAAQPAVDLPDNDFVGALEANQQQLVTDRIENHPVVLALQQVIEPGPFHGTMARLHEQMTGPAFNRERHFPSTAQHLSRQLDRLRPALRTVGIVVEHGERTRVGRTVRVYRIGQEPEGATPEPEPEQLDLY
jgi:hypothetical protein